MALEYVPMPLLSVVWLLVTSGSWFVPQHTPLAVMAAPPSVVMVPPLFAVVAYTALAAMVLIVGRSAGAGVVVSLVQAKEMNRRGNRVIILFILQFRFR